jgi:hypothetical protein
MVSHYQITGMANGKGAIIRKTDILIISPSGNKFFYGTAPIFK